MSEQLPPGALLQVKALHAIIIGTGSGGFSGSAFMTMTGSSTGIGVSGRAGGGIEWVVTGGSGRNQMATTITANIRMPTPIQ